MVDVEIALGHHLLQVPEAEPKPQVPTDTQDNDLGFEMSSLKQCRAVRSHPPQGTRSPSGLQHFQISPLLRGLSQVESRGWSTYNSLQMKVTKRFSRSFMMLHSYTYGQVLDIASVWRQLLFPVSDNYFSRSTTITPEAARSAAAAEGRRRVWESKPG